jgi:RNA polymerase sigma-70 factor (ECF subfamily)
MPDASRGDAPDAEARRAVTRICEVLDEVDERGRMAFVLRHVEGYELTEVAQSLGCSLATAKRSLAKVQGRVSAMAK